jgi:hypothetical protein
MSSLSFGVLYLEDVERLGVPVFITHRDGTRKILSLTDKDRFLYSILCAHKHAKTGIVRISNERLAYLGHFKGSERPDGRARWKGLELSLGRLERAGLISLQFQRGGRAIGILRPDRTLRTYP